jgi:hypothetical protein
MKRMLALTLLSVAILASNLVGFAKPSLKGRATNRATPATASTSADQISAKVDAQVKSAVTGGLTDFAKSANLPLNAQKADFTVLGNAVVGVAPIYGIEKLTAKDYDSGKTLGVLYLSSAIEFANLRTKLPAGFYEIRVLGDPKSPNSKIQFIRQGKVSAESPTKIASAAPSQDALPSAKPLSVSDSLKGAVASAPYTESAIRPVAYTSNPASTPVVQAVCQRICVAILEFKRFRISGCQECGPWQFTGGCFFN